MLRLRPYKNCDAQYIIKWCKDEMAFRRWCAERYEKYPISADDMNTTRYWENGGSVWRWKRRNIYEAKNRVEYATL